MNDCLPINLIHDAYAYNTEHYDADLSGTNSFEDESFFILIYILCSTEPIFSNVSAIIPYPLSLGFIRILLLEFMSCFNYGNPMFCANYIGTNQKEPKAAGGSLSQNAARTPLIPILCSNCGTKDDHWTIMCPCWDLQGQGQRAEKSVRVSNISKDTQEQGLRDLFCPFGLLRHVYIALDHMTGISRGFGFVDFMTREDAKRAFNKLDGYVYDNHMLKIEWPAPRRTMLEELKAIGGCMSLSPGRTHPIKEACGTCGKKANHWTSLCPYRDHTEDELNAYIPPCCKGRVPWVEIMVKVSNLSKDTGEQELHDLFSPFGQLSRVHIAVDHKAGIINSMGFGFVEFVSKEDGERAINKLDGCSYDKHILKVDWAAPKFVGKFWNVPCRNHSTIY